MKIFFQCLENFSFTQIFLFGIYNTKCPFNIELTVHTNANDVYDELAHSASKWKTSEFRSSVLFGGTT